MLVERGCDHPLVADENREAVGLDAELLPDLVHLVAAASTKPPLAAVVPPEQIVVPVTVEIGHRWRHRLLTQHVEPGVGRGGQRLEVVLDRRGDDQGVDATPAEAGRVLARFDRFWQCRDCGKVYWRGSHYEQMLQRLRRLGLLSADAMESEEAND